MNTISHRTMTKLAIKNQLLTNLWTILTVIVVVPLLSLIQGILNASFRIEINGVQIIDEAFNGTLPWLPAGALAIGIIVAFVAFIVSITSAATARTYLGAGMSRRSIFRMNLCVWLASALSMALFTCLALIAYFAVTGDFSGNINLDLPENISAPFGTPTGTLWFTPLVVFFIMLYAHATGYFFSMLFVRLPWWIPVAVLVVATIVNSWLDNIDGIFPIGWEGSFLSFSNFMVTLFAQLLFWITVYTAASWLLLRRLPLRR